MAAMRWFLVAISCVTLSSLACAASPGPSAPPSAAPVEAAVERGGESEPELVSVRPGVNDRYFEDDALAVYSDILERERREVIAHRDEIVAALELEPGTIVADVGAGTGAFLAPLSQVIGEQGKLYAVDIVPAFLTHLRERAASEELTNVEVVEATPTRVNLGEASVDLLFMCDVYHHIEYPSVYLRSLHRALRPDGRFVVVEFDKIPGETSKGMMKHVRQDKQTLITEVTAEGFVLEREIDSVPLDENYMLVFHK
jgi:predicted methyltransferase